MVMGMEEDPEDNAAVAASVFIAVVVYAVSYAHPVECSFEADDDQGFLVFCGFQAWLHVRASRRGAISL